ncbi:hypothetical protein [Fusobacterium varium]|jgi:hypothetical protein
MKKTFFMIGILAALSMTAFGAGSESPLTIPITGSSLTPVTIGSDRKSIDFGKVISGTTKKSGEIKLTLEGTGNEKIKLTSQLNNATNVSMVTDVPTGSVPLVSGTVDVPIELQYAPTAGGESLDGASLIITAEYDDTDWTK